MKRETGSSRAILVLLVLAFSGACGSAQRADVPPPVPTVSVVMREYAFEHAPLVPAGRVVFEVRNHGHVEHALSMLRMPDDETGSIHDMLADGDPELFGTTAQLFAHRPGSRGVFAVDLTPGRYALICFAEDPDGRQHLTKGMASEFRVGTSPRGRQT